MMMISRTSTALAILTAVALLAAGCGSTGSSLTSDATTDVTSTTASVTTTVSARESTSTTDPSATTDPSGTSATPVTSTTGTSTDGGCTASQLSASLGDGGAAAGNRYQTVVFTNTSDSSCTLYGFAGVSLVSSSGKDLGDPATRQTGDNAARVTLAAHSGTASFLVHTTGDVNGTGCQPASSAINIIPPNTKTVIRLDGAIKVCEGRFSISPVVAGDSGRS